MIMDIQMCLSVIHIVFNWIMKKKINNYKD